MTQFSIEDFEGKIDSLYRLVLVAAHRASQVNRPEMRPFLSAISKKPTMVALEEILEGKVTYRVDEDGDEASIDE